MSLDENNETLSVFKDALDQMMCVPGDWHAGLSMLQSIMNIFWDGFCRTIGINCLGWKRIQKDARSCYFQDSRLVVYVYEQLTALLMQSFASQEFATMKDLFKSNETDQRDANFMCYFASEFDQ